MSKILMALVAIAAATASRGQAAAEEIENVRFVEGYRVGDHQLRLHNVGSMRYKRVIKAMVAGLYLQSGVESDRALDDVAKRLEIEYFWSLKAKDIVKASDKLLQDNVDARTLQRLRPKIEQLHAMYGNVQAGDRYALTYLPGRGTFLALNGKLQGKVEGADFAAVYFSIWLGDQPMDKSLKKQLLAPRR